MAPLSGGPRAVRLTAADDPQVRQLLARQPGHGLFIESTLLSYGYVHLQVRLWGLFRPAPEPALLALLMITTAGCSIFAPEPVDLTPLTAIIARERPPYVMGLADVVTRAMTPLAIPDQQIERHYFAELPRQHFTPVRARDGAVVVRPATRADVTQLAMLYVESPDFADLAFDRLERLMELRVTHYQTWIVLQDAEVLAAASTSAETPQAAMIGGVWTAPDRRSQGFGTLVVSALCATLWRQRRRPYLFYLVENLAAARVYGRLGFRVMAEWKVVHLV